MIRNLKREKSSLSLSLLLCPILFFDSVYCLSLSLVIIYCNIILKLVASWFVIITYLQVCFTWYFRSRVGYWLFACSVFLRWKVGCACGQMWDNFALEKACYMDLCGCFLHRWKRSVELAARWEWLNFAVLPICLPHCRLNWWEQVSYQSFLFS